MRIKRRRSGQARSEPPKAKGRVGEGEPGKRVADHADLGIRAGGRNPGQDRCRVRERTGKDDRQVAASRLGVGENAWRPAALFLDYDQGGPEASA